MIRRNRRKWESPSIDLLLRVAYPLALLLEGLVILLSLGLLQMGLPLAVARQAARLRFRRRQQEQ